MPLAVKINVALREQNCQKIGSERVNPFVSRNILLNVVTPFSVTLDVYRMFLPTLITWN